MSDGMPDLSGIVSVLVYYTKSVSFLSICCDAIKQFQKTRQVYDLKSDMVCDAHFFCINVNDFYNHDTESVDLSYQLQNVYQVDHWMLKYKLWWYIFFWGRGLFLVNA